MRHLHHFPAWTNSNPYTNMLHQAILASGWKVTGTTELAPMLRAVASLERGDVFHIQWTSPIVGSANNETEARSALDRFREGIDRARSAGVAIVWTVHNKIPHVGRYRELEVALAEYLADASDRIIQLNPYTRSAVADAYDLPESKLATLPHASYVGLYGEMPSQREARAELGVPVSAPTVGFVGQVRHYKGVSTLLEAMRLLSQRVEDVTLLLAGKTNPHEAGVLEKAMPRNIRTVRRHDFLPDEDMATWFAAADVMAFPYRDILNSGSLLLSATFGRPAILPSLPHLEAAYGDEAWVRFYDAAEHAPEHLASAIEESLATAHRDRRAATAFARSYTTFDMATGFSEILEETIRAMRVGSGK